MNESEPLKKCRESVPTAKTGDLLRSWEEYSDYLFIGYAAVVIEMA
jgi:hypothetical protein